MANTVARNAAGSRDTDWFQPGRPGTKNLASFAKSDANAFRIATDHSDANWRPLERGFLTPFSTRFRAESHRAGRKIWFAPAHRSVARVGAK